MKNIILLIFTISIFGLNPIIAQATLAEHQANAETAIKKEANLKKKFDKQEKKYKAIKRKSKKAKKSLDSYKQKSAKASENAESMRASGLGTGNADTLEKAEKGKAKFEKLKKRTEKWKKKSEKLNKKLNSEEKRYNSAKKAWEKAAKEKKEMMGKMKAAEKG